MTLSFELNIFTIQYFCVFSFCFLFKTDNNKRHAYFNLGAPNNPSGLTKAC